MKKNKTLSVIGGDSRQLFAAQYLGNSGYDVTLFGCEHGNIPEGAQLADNIDNAMCADIILLPLPVTKNGKAINTPLSSCVITLKDVADRLTDRHSVFLGMGQPNLIRQLQAKAGFICDYFKIEEFTYKNALLTAEGILSIILDRLPVTVFGLNAAVIGYGRIGGFISDMLKGLGADVTVFARNSLQRTKASAKGLTALHTNEIKNTVGNFSCIINTVPSRIIDEDAISAVGNGAILIEAASAPYGINAEACSRHSKTLIKAFSLPGKTAPKSAGIIIGETVRTVLDGGEAQ